jgi:threonine aldolase
MWSGVIVDQIESTAGIFSPDQLAACLPERSVYAPAPAVVCVEQTHNFGGGTVWSLDDVRAVCEFAHKKGLSTHLDGARLFNAVVATTVPAKEWCRHFDSVFIDFSKSLGAPFGAVLAGNQDFIDEARRYKHAFGGAMRQAGIMAAACIFALENNIERLKDDHENARFLADQLDKISGLHILTPQPHSNMVFFDTTNAGISARDFVDNLSRNGVIMSTIEHRVRAVTHLGISREDCLKAAEVVQQVVSREAASAR